MAAHAKSHLTRERAQYLRRVKGARNAHASMRAEGRIPGDEGREAIARIVRHVSEIGKRA